MNRKKSTVILFIAGFAVLIGSSTASAKGKIIHDAEFQLLQEQYGEKWAAEDKEIDKELEVLRKKHGKRPNIIHIMWDDMKYGAIGHPMLNNVTGYKSPNINRLASQGMTFTRMYTEPSCTPTRVAAATGRQPDLQRNSAVGRGTARSSETSAIPRAGRQ